MRWHERRSDGAEAGLGEVAADGAGGEVNVEGVVQGQDVTTAGGFGRYRWPGTVAHRE
jgi:hypothetical protein